MAEVRPK